MTDSSMVVALTPGDPAGIGPEILAKALADRDWTASMVPVVVGDATVMESVVQGCGLDLKVRSIESISDAAADPSVVDVLDCGVIDGAIPYGQIDEACGLAALSYIRRTCELIKSGEVDGFVTGPINKEAVWAAGSKFPGHTELLADLLDVPQSDVVTMFVLDRLRIFFLTRHHSLLDAVAKINVDETTEFLHRVDGLLGDLGVEGRPRIALAALNPHGGENGHLGTEELDILRPAVERAESDGLDVLGPVPADAVFFQGRQGQYDGVVALHHDQGHIAAKTVDFFGTVACQLGLPVLRTTVDHGTAFDIAGTWVANAHGQIRAMEVLAELGPRLLRSASAAP